MIISNPLELLFPSVFFELRGHLEPARAMLKLEGFNVTGSVKLKSALFMVDRLEQQGRLHPGQSTIVESSSGNLGVALALICRMRGYGFICVVDPNVSPANAHAIEAYGGTLLRVETRDANGGYLRTRLDLVRKLLADNPDRVWVNQYANPANITAHANWTAAEILDSVPDVTHLYVGTGTTGTMMGLAARFAELSPHTELVAVEPEGSVTFRPDGGGRRLLPGVGTSRRPEIADSAAIDRVVFVQERDAVLACHAAARDHGLLLGGSSGHVLAAMTADHDRFDSDSVVLGISPDLGDKYLDTVYSPEWVAEHFGLITGPTPHPPRPLCGPIKEVIEAHTTRLLGAEADRIHTPDSDRRPIPDP